MRKFATVAELNEAIQLLETERIIHLEMMNNEFSMAYEKYRPGNLIKNTIKKIGSSPSLYENIFNVGLALIAGFLSNKALSISNSNRKPGKFLGLILQLGVANLVVHGPKVLKSVLQRVSGKRKAD